MNTKTSKAKKKEFHKSLDIEQQETTTKHLTFSNLLRIPQSIIMNTACSSFLSPTTNVNETRAQNLFLVQTASKCHEMKHLSL